jgi:hypothetical protein
VSAGILAVVLLAVGLPALTFWLGGRRFWDRTPAARQGELHRETVRAHALRPAEIAQVEGAVTWGRELADPRLRAAVVAWAALAVVVLGWGISAGDWQPVVQVLVQIALLAPVTWLLARGPNRAIERNSGPPP